MLPDLDPFTDRRRRFALACHGILPDGPLVTVSRRMLAIHSDGIKCRSIVWRALACGRRDSIPRDHPSRGSRRHVRTLRRDGRGLPGNRGRAGAENEQGAAPRVRRGLWTFARVEGVEPTYSAAERAVRKAVRWRKISFGSASRRGSRFAERMLTVCESLRAQGRSILEFLVRALHSRLNGSPRPSLLPP
jgi:hypothetical protein